MTNKFLTSSSESNEILISDVIGLRTELDTIENIWDSNGQTGPNCIITMDETDGKLGIDNLQSSIGATGTIKILSNVCINTGVDTTTRLKVAKTVLGKSAVFQDNGTYDMSTNTATNVEINASPIITNPGTYINFISDLTCNNSPLTYAGYFTNHSTSTVANGIYSECQSGSTNWAGYFLGSVAVNSIVDINPMAARDNSLGILKLHDGYNLSGRGKIQFHYNDTGSTSTLTSQIHAYWDTDEFIAFEDSNGDKKMRIDISQGVYGTPGSDRQMYCNSANIIGCVASVKACKTNINDLGNCSWVYQLKPKTFEYRKKDKNKFLDEGTGRIKYGLIAEECVELTTKDKKIYDIIDYDDEQNHKNLFGVKYDNLNIALLKVVQDQKKEINELKKQVDDDKKVINTLNNNVINLIDLFNKCALKLNLEQISPKI